MISLFFFWTLQTMYFYVLFDAAAIAHRLFSQPELVGFKNLRVLATTAANCFRWSVSRHANRRARRHVRSRAGRLSINHRPGSQASLLHRRITASVP
jgi:hypothetical protein